jgi:hypothetical protein
MLHVGMNFFAKTDLLRPQGTYRQEQALFSPVVFAH